jgi:general secretion pathway protein D
MMTIVEEIDKKSPPGKEMIHVYYLKNSTAEDLAKTLTEMYAKMAARRVGKEKTLAIEEKPTIVADKLTNSLILIADPTQYEELEKIIAKLDIPRQKVLVEAMVAEVTLEKLMSMGVEWAAIAERGGHHHGVFGGTDLGIRRDLMTGTLYGTTLGMYYKGSYKYVNPATGKVEEIDNPIGTLINLSAGDSDINILSTPYLLTNNNQEAEIKVVENRPMVTASRISEEGVQTETYTREDVGINMKITPQINPEGFVTLKIYQEIARVTAELATGYPIVAKRAADTTVTVKDGETVVIGGLLREDKSVIEKRVPGLGRIPGLGWLFKRKEEVSQKISLVIFLTPRVVTTPEEIRTLTEKKEEERKAFEERLEK